VHAIARASGHAQTVRRSEAEQAEEFAKGNP
jgi:hypothetical protein